MQKLEPIHERMGSRHGELSISDDDLCATCEHCEYRPGDMSGRKRNWPGLVDEFDYVQECTEFIRITSPR